MANKAREIVIGLLASGMSKAKVADEIGYGRSSVSRWINEPDYNGALIEAAVLARYDRLLCPHLKQEITPGDCASYACRAVPTSNAREVRHWKACQSCSHKPKQGGQS